ncbi:MAG: radical SAM protein [Nitrososphaeria archaeon]
MAYEYDVVLLHPPSFYDFRKKTLFPGPIASTVQSYTHVFLMFPIGLISIGAYLEDLGVKVRIFNLAEKMLTDRSFNVEEFLRKLNAIIYGIDLHWAVHSQGSIRIAEICKKYHPEAFIILGGLTATCFSEEIVKRFKFVDGIINGEGEEAIYYLFSNVKKFNKLDALYRSPNLTFFDDTKGTIIRTPHLKVANNIDFYDFTRLNLVEPNIRTLTSAISKEKVWMLPISRGCLLNCAICGGSSFSYRRLMCREKPAFRSPKKLLEDFMILDEQNIDSIFLFQDIRLGGKRYVDEFLSTFKRSKWARIKNVGLEFFYPSNKTYIENISKNRPADYIGISISPESGDESIRVNFGRPYTNQALLSTCRYCKEANIPIGVFFLTGLGHETIDSLNKTYKLWDKIGLTGKDIRTKAPIFVEVGAMILLDPGSLAFSNPGRYGYKLKFKNFYDYYQAMEKSPFWIHWISYETINFNTIELARLMIESEEKMLEYKRKYNNMEEKIYKIRRMYTELEKVFILEYDKINKIVDPKEYSSKIIELEEILKNPILARSFILTYNHGGEYDISI